MAILKRTDIYEGGKALEEIKKEITELIGLQKELQKATREVNATGSGAEAKERLMLTKQLSDANNKLIQAESRQAKELALIKEATRQANAENRKLAQEELRVIGVYKQKSDLLNKLRKEYKDLILVEGKETKQLKAKRLEIVKLDTQLKKLDAMVGQHQRSVGNYSKALQGVGRQLLGAAGITTGVTALVGVVKNAINIFVTFDKSVSKLASILGKTKDQIAALTKQAKDLGSVTAYTASQVIDAQTELAKLGLSVKQIEAAIPGVLSLAAATGQDLASSAELAASTLRIFNFDASEMGRVSDVLAKSTTISSLSMEKLATIMPTVGKTAQLAGVSLERTAALAGTLTDRGLDASTAATSLRNIFLELSKKGLTWEQAMQKINTSTDKNKTAMDLFGKRAAAAGAILAETGATTDDLTLQLENATGAAKEMADTMLDNLAGDITIAQSAWEGFILSLEDGEGVLSSILRNVTQFFTSLLEGLKNLNDGVIKLTSSQREQYGITKATTEAIKRQDKILTAIADKEKQQLEAKKRYYFYGQKIAEFEKEALAAKDRGDKTAIGRANEQIIAFTALRDNLTKYIPELKKETGQIEETTVKVKELTRAEKKRIDQRKQDEQERLRRQQVLGNIPGTVESLTATGVETPDIAIQATKDLEKNLADVRQAERDKELERIREFEEAKKEIRNTFEDEAANYAINVASQIADDKKNKDLNAIEAKKDALKDQLDKGLINEIQYQTRLAELNKQARQAEARAEKRKALYEIAINTAVAVVKALPSLLRAGLAAAQGAIQAAFVAAQPLPKFEKGGKIEGKRHSQGGVDINAEGGEYMLNRQAYANAPMLAEAINSGMLRDKDLGLRKGQKDNLLAGLLMQSNNLNKQMLYTLGNLGYSVQKKDYIEERRANGEIIKHIIK